MHALRGTLLTTHLGGDGEVLPGAGHGLSHIPDGGLCNCGACGDGAGLLIPAMTMSSVTCDHVYKAHMPTSCSLSPFPPSLDSLASYVAEVGYAILTVRHSG